MKRMLAGFLAVLLVLSCSAAAFAQEEFTLRSGIHFGDTMEDILSKETKLVRESETSNWFKGTIAGFENASCGFYFDNDGKLTSMDYSFTDMDSRTEVNDDYKTLYDSLVRKYGKPLGNVGGKIDPITGPALMRMAVLVQLYKFLDGYDADYMDYDEWRVDTLGGHVKIDLVSYYYRDDDYKYCYQLDLSYHFYTDADYEQAVSDKIAKRNEIDNDL